MFQLLQIKFIAIQHGGVEWDGFSVNLLFMKGLLDKLEIEPQIFYAGKFKSATEPFRVSQMTDANRLQTTDWLNDLYNNFCCELQQQEILIQQHYISLQSRAQFKQQTMH